MQRSINKTLTVGRQWGFSHLTPPLRHHHKGLNECLVKGQSSWTRTYKFPHRCTEKRTERKVVLFIFSPIADKHTRRCTNVTHTVAKFILSNHGLKFCWQRHTLRKWRWHRGGGEEGRAGGGYCRAHKAAWIQVFFCVCVFFFCSFWDAFSVLRFYSKGRGSVSLSQAGNRKREPSIKAIEASE